MARVSLQIVQHEIAREQERAAWRPSFQPFNEHCYARQNADHNSHCFRWDDHVAHQALLALERAEAEANRAAWDAYYQQAGIQQ